MGTSNAIPTVEEADAADKEMYRLADIEHMASQLYIKLVTAHSYGPTMKVLRQLHTQARKAAEIYYELPKKKA